MEHVLPFRIDTWLAVLAGAALISTTLAHADVLVLKSDVAEIAKKSVLQDDAIIDVPENKSVKVILKPSNVTKVIKGPYKGTAKDYGGGTDDRFSGRISQGEHIPNSENIPLQN